MTRSSECWPASDPAERETIRGAAWRRPPRRKCCVKTWDLGRHTCHMSVLLLNTNIRAYVESVHYRLYSLRTRFLKTSLETLLKASTTSKGSDRGNFSRDVRQHYTQSKHTIVMAEEQHAPLMCSSASRRTLLIASSREIWENTHT